jgi:hypothetical protein
LNGAFAHIASPGETSSIVENMKNLLTFCQTFHTMEVLCYTSFANAFRSIDKQIEILNALTGDVSTEETTKFKDY